MISISSITNLIRGLALYVLLVFSPSPTTIPTTGTPIATESAHFSVQDTSEFAENAQSPNLDNVHYVQVQVAATPRLKPIDQYIMEPHPGGEEGFYVLKNTPDEPMTTQDELNIAVNNYRKAHNLNQLAIDEDLCEIATQRASEAAVHFSHDGFKQHIENGDYNYTGFYQIGENLWQGSFSGVHIVEFGWDRSPGHRANLQGDWTKGCGGIYQTTVAFIFAK